MKNSKNSGKYRCPQCDIRMVFDPLENLWTCPDCREVFSTYYLECLEVEGYFKKQKVFVFR